MTSPVEEIKSKLDIADVVRGYLELQPAGKNFKALCPFHREKSPSFIVSPDRQTWHCFGCALGGDMFSFVMRFESLEFGEALKILAEKAGVELKRIGPAEYEQFGLFYDINDAATRFFKVQLTSMAVANEYLTSRGLTRETVEKFDVGYAPNAPEALTMYLLNLGFRPEAILKAGLSFKTQNGLQVDRFRGRIMFPIHNPSGKVVGFTGRILPQFDTGEMGKYVNSPETPVFVKSRILYGLHQAKPGIREKGSVLLVEGQMDCLMAHQAGVTYTVATSGTALTLDHLHLLRKLTDQIILSFDSDEAGLQAGERAIDLSLANDFNVKVLTFSPGSFKDPAEAIQADAAAFIRHIDDAEPAIRFYIHRYLASPSSKPRGGQDFSAIKKGIRVVLGKIKKVSSPTEQELWLKEVGDVAGLQAKSLAEEFKQLGTEDEKKLIATNESQTFVSRVFTRRERLNLHLLSVASSLSRVKDVESVADLLLPTYREAYALLAENRMSSPDPAIDELLNIILLTANSEANDRELETVLRYVREEFLKDTKRELEIQIKQAERAGDEAARKSALEELNKLIQTKP